jgi:spore photoproduct lyase
LNPEEIAKKVEAKAPTLARRLDALVKLQAQGWQIGLRFDPMIYQTGYQQQYRQLFEQVFSMINIEQLHSVSLGAFRLPEKFFKKMNKLYPEERLFAGPLVNQQGMVSYRQELEQEMTQYCTEQLLRFIPRPKFVPCTL